MNIINTKTRCVANLCKTLTFVRDSQDVEAIKDYLGDISREYDSFFVHIDNGEYIEVWGMCGIVPRNSKLVSLLTND